jgi:hypothetical protein
MWFFYPSTAIHPTVFVSNADIFKLYLSVAIFKRRAVFFKDYFLRTDLKVSQLLDCCMMMMMMVMNLINFMNVIIVSE